MKIRSILGLVVLAAMLVLPSASSGLAPDAAAGEYPFALADVVGRSVASIVPAGGRIDVAVSSAYEAHPQVAICASNQYLVVYEYLAGDTDPFSIYGQRLTSQGELLGAPFEIDLQDNNATEPDVACEWSTDRFVVVWTYDFAGNSSDTDVYSRSVYGSHQASDPQLASGLVWVSRDTTYEQSPAIACNSDDASCLVVFSYLTAPTDLEIKGQRLVVTAPGIGHDGDRFDISLLPNHDRSPDVAWGALDENYLVVWESYYTSDSSGNYHIMSGLIHDTEQGDGVDERQAIARFLVDPVGWPRTQLVPAVAYNRQAGTSGRYLVVFRYDPGDIVARRVKATDGLSEGDPFSVDQATNDTFRPAVAFSGGPEESGAGADQFLVTYLVSDGTVEGAFLYGQAIKGTHAATGSQLDGTALEIARSAYSTDDAELNQGGVTGSAHNGRYAVVWQDSDSESIDNVFGQMITPYAIYLPLILNNP